MDFRDYLMLCIDSDAIRLKYYRKFASSKVQGILRCRHDKRRNRDSYYIEQDGREKYVKQEPNKTIWALQMKRFGSAMSRVLEHNIGAKERLLNELLSDSPDEIMKKLPKAYRPNQKFQPKAAVKRIRQSENPYKREQLKLCTSFGLWVRTKGELLIAELLCSMGIEFSYEKGMTLMVQRITSWKDRDGIVHKETEWIHKKYYPDFTITLPNGREIYWEHKGMLDKPEYVKRDMQKEIDYNVNGIYQPHNLMVTTEGPNNEMDMDGIRRIVDGWLVPLLVA